MIPRAAASTLKNTDLLYLAQPDNNLGERSKAVELSALFSSDPAKYAPRIICSNILEYSGALAATSTSAYTEVAHVDIDPRLDVQFHVWGTSDPASDGSEYNTYSYGLRACVRMMYLPDDQDRDLVAIAPSGFRNSDSTGPAPTYNAFFGCLPFNYSPSSSELQYYPTKRVTLYLSTGTTGSPYHGIDPASFALNIQATIFPRQIDTTILKATATP
jgi:hypothetical protein